MDKLDIVIIGAVVVAGVYWFRNQQNHPPVAPQPVANNGVAPPGSATPAAPGSAAVVEAPVALNPHKDHILLKTPKNEVELSTLGASVTSIKLLDVRESTYHAAQAGADDDRKPDLLRVEQVNDSRVPLRSFVVAPGAGDLPSLAKASQIDWAHEELDGGATQRFTLQLEDGLRLVKTYSAPKPFPRDASDKAEPLEEYHFDLKLEVQNPTSQPRSFGYALVGPVGLCDPSVDRRAGQQALLAVKHGKKVSLDTYASLGLTTEKSVSPSAESDQVGVFGLETKYFATVVIPRNAPYLAKVTATGLLPGVQTPILDRDKEEGGLAHQALVVAQAASRDIPPGKASVETFEVYAGPKRKAIFEAAPGPYAGEGLEQLVNYGWFELLALLLLNVLRAFHWVVGNWGFSIMLLTLLVRGMLLPLSIWSQKNMLRMQKMAPELNKLKEKYSKKDGTMTPDQQRAFGAAQMDLFRTHGVNPVGCLGPIFLQLPVFYGLWNALNFSFELRQQPFVGWIHDLTVPDVLFRLGSGGWKIPILGTNALSVLPLIMVGCYYLQMRLQPTPTDPRAAEQQQMMKFMMPIFGLLMYTAPSGLMIYFITSACWTMVESKWVKRHLERTEGPLPPTAVTAPSM